MYKVIFNVTETLQNGNERRVQKVVYMPRFDEYGKHMDEPRRIERGTAALAAEHYYNIEYGSTVTTEIIFA
jgi:hypothetical protein